jgi:hypothetical protein
MAVRLTKLDPVLAGTGAGRQPVRWIAVKPLCDRGQGVARLHGVVAAGRLIAGDDGVGMDLLDDRSGPGGDRGGVCLRGSGEHTHDRQGRGGLACRLRYPLHLRRRRVPARSPDLPRTAVYVR